MATALNSMKDAELACLGFLGRVLGVKVGAEKGDITLGDWLDPTLVNSGKFAITGGPEQSQNLGVRRPGCGWIADAQFLMQFETRAEAVEVVGKLQNGFQAVKSDGSAGIEPNVSNFEILTHPQIETFPYSNGDGEIVGLVFMLTVNLRVVYSNRQQ